MTQTRHHTHQTSVTKPSTYCLNPTGNFWPGGNTASPACDGPLCSTNVWTGDSGTDREVICRSGTQPVCMDSVATPVTSTPRVTQPSGSSPAEKTMQYWPHSTCYSKRRPLTWLSTLSSSSEITDTVSWHNPLSHTDHIPVTWLTASLAV